MKIFIKLFCISLTAYILFCLFLYTSQEDYFFVPTKLDKNHKFSFNTEFSEIDLIAKNGIRINGLRFYAKNTTRSKNNEIPKKQAILFFHGNAGNLDGWGKYGEFFPYFGYDFFVFDYRGFGKSAGKVTNEEELFSDTDLMFEEVLKNFKKEEIVVFGYSLGTGLSVRIAEKFKISKLILVSPYFRWDYLAKEKFSFIPSFLVKFKITTADFLENFIKNNPNSQVYIFHGKYDRLIDISHSQKLSKIIRPSDKFFTLDCAHNDILNNPEFVKIIGEILQNK